MASTLTLMLVHITFSTKNRVPMIVEADEPDLCAYVGGICRRMDSPLMAMNGTADHVHLLVSLSKTVSLSELLLNIKRDSSKWMKARDGVGEDFAWQEGYFGFSIGQSGVKRLREYIANQKPHHATETFQDEMRAFMRKYGVEWDERYVWS
jgi:REP element-mobilizing transposase RayT